VNRRDFCQSALLPFALQAQRRPDFLFIRADDLGYGDLSPYGAPDISTPNIDLVQVLHSF
jgi:hypothetical protein